MGTGTKKGRSLRSCFLLLKCVTWPDTLEHMVRIFLFLLFLPLGLSSASFFDETGADFKQYVQTKEDKERYAFFKNRFENQAQSSPISSPSKIFHFIWLGPKPIPQEATSAIQSWLDIHPT